MVYGKSRPEKAFQVFNISLLSLLGVAFVLPYLLILMGSVTTETAFYANGYSLFPKAVTFEGYRKLFTENNDIYTGFANSLLITVGGTLISVAVTAMMAYALSKPCVRGRGVVNGLLIFSMLFSGGVIPTYILIQRLELTNTQWSVILPGAMSPWNCLMMRSYLKTLPDALEDAAKIDGAGHFKIMASVYFPLCLPMLATITLFTSVSLWNQWASSVLYFNTTRFRNMMPLTVILRERIQKNISPSSSGGTETVAENVKMATAVITTLPIILAYPFLQKYFISGMTLGSVKG